MEVESKIQLFEHRYYRLNKMLMQLIGQWPYQRISVRFAILAFSSLVAMTHLLPQMWAIVLNRHDWDLLMEGAAGLLFFVFCFIKQATLLFKTGQMKILLNRIHTDWKAWAQDHDVEILHQYAQKGRLATIMYSVISYTTCTLYIIQPVIPKIVDITLKNGSKPGQFPDPADYYFFDEQKYYFYVILHCYANASLGFIGSMAYDSMFIVTTQHVCGLFAALGHKLQRIGNGERSTETGKIMDLKKLSWCVARHRDAIEYAEFMEAFHSWSFFVVMGSNMLLISVAGLQIAKITTDVQQTIRFIFATVVAMGHLFIDNYMAQRLMDHSSSIHYLILNSEWYKLPVKTQKILLFILMRCNVPCKLTAGKISILSIPTFGLILKTSLSYFTLLHKEVST